MRRRRGSALGEIVGDRQDGRRRLCALVSQTETRQGPTVQLGAHAASRDAARELLLCVTQDGEPFEQAAVRAGAGPERTLLFLEDAPESMAPHLVSAVPGECTLLEDAEQEEQEPPVVIYVAEKIPPQWNQRTPCSLKSCFQLMSPGLSCASCARTFCSVRMLIICPVTLRTEVICSGFISGVPRLTAMAAWLVFLPAALPFPA